MQNNQEEKLISAQDQWSNVQDELSSEELKLVSYDNTLLSIAGNIKGQKVLDYGCGPGVLAAALQKRGAQVNAYDISPEMRKSVSKIIGDSNVHHDVKDIPKDNFDLAICNLVLCIVDEEEAKKIARNLRDIIHGNGTAYVGFCNPMIHDVSESRLDFRFSNSSYHENHNYEKIKKEGNYKIVEMHRPLEWYTRIFQEAGLRLERMHFTPQYTLNDRHVNDFVIFELKK